MSIHLGNIEFDYVDYDSRYDVLTLNVDGPPRPPDDIGESAEYHHLRFEGGELVGMQILNAAALLKDAGMITVTIGTNRQVLATRELTEALAAATEAA